MILSAKFAPRILLTSSPPIVFCPILSLVSVRPLCIICRISSPPASVIRLLPIFWCVFCIILKLSAVIIEFPGSFLASPFAPSSPMRLKSSTSFFNVWFFAAPSPTVSQPFSPMKFPAIAIFSFVQQYSDRAWSGRDLHPRIQQDIPRLLHRARSSGDRERARSS